MTTIMLQDSRTAAALTVLHPLTRRLTTRPGHFTFSAPLPIPDGEWWFEVELGRDEAQALVAAAQQFQCQEAK